MAEQFEDAADPLGGTDLTPSPGLAGAPEPPPPLPSAPAVDVSPIVSAMPRLQGPPPPPPPPMPMDDPRQRLATIFATAFAMGAGPRSGTAAGVLQGLQQQQAAMHGENLQRWQYQADQQRAQAKLVEQQQAELDRQRANKLTAEIDRFRAAAQNAPNKDEFDRLAELYGNGLSAQGYRGISPNWLRANVPYVQPSKQARAEQAWGAWLSNDNNKTLLQQNPAMALGSMVQVDLNGDGVKENVPLSTLADIAGHGFARDAQGGLIAVPKPQAGTGAFDVKFNALLDQFRVDNKREPNPKERNDLIDKAIEASKEKPASVGTGAFNVKLQALLDQFKSNSGRDPNQNERNTLIDQAIEASKEKPPTPVVPSYTPPQPEIDPSTGRPTGRFFSYDTKNNRWVIPKGVGPVQTTKGGPNAVTANRLDSAKAVTQTGQDIINEVRKNAAILGPLMSRYNSAADFFGAPPPEFARLAGLIESYSLANMGVHGMRSANGAEAIKQTIGLGRHTPESLISTVEGLNGFAQHFMENEGRSAGTDAGWVDVGNGVKVRKKQ